MDFETPQSRLDRFHAALVEGTGPLLIVVHDYPDPDCLAAAMAARTLLARWNLEADIAYGGGLGRPGNKAMVGLLDIELRVFDELDLPTYRGAVLVDTRPGAGNNSLPERVPVRAVIDNHAGGDKEIEAVYTDVRSDCGATSSILFEYLDAAGVEAEGVLATALFLGIKTDTEGLERDAGPADRDAYARLLAQADLETANKITRPPLTEDYFRMLQATLADACRFGEAVAATLGPVPVPDLLSAMSDLLIQAKGAAWALVAGWHEKRVYVSLRIRPPRRNAANIITKTLSPEGRGGGHAIAAGGQIDPADGDLERAASDATERFLQAVGMQGEPPRQLCAKIQTKRRTRALGKRSE